MSLTICIACSSSAVLNFLVFWLVLGEKMKVHRIGGREVYLAPVYLALVCIGMVGLVYAPRCVAPPSEAQMEALSDNKPEEDDGLVVGAERCDGAPSDASSLGAAQVVRQLGSLSEPLVSPKDSVTPEPHAAGGAGALSFVRLLAGVLIALASGVLAAIQYAVVNLGKRYESHHLGCAEASDPPPPLPATPLPPAAPPSPPPIPACVAMTEQFDNFGSWMISFGFGAVLITSVLLGCFALASTRYTSLPFPSPQLRIMAVPGSLAGLSWSIANFCGTAAAKLESNSSGGDAVVYVAMMCTQLVVSGLWGIFYYREIRGKQAVAWVACALWTMTFMALLGMEKAK